MNAPQTRDVIVVGSSLGGIEALSLLLGGLPSDLPAAVAIVQHLSDESPTVLAMLLDRLSALPVVTAEQGMELRRGQVYVAPPDQHLLLGEHGIEVTFGPRENRSRPAVDPLFRTAAVHYRSRVIGVILTGLLGDGAAGLLAVHRCGGVAVVQSPEDALAPSMPRRALEQVPEARTASLAELPALLALLAGSPAPHPPPVPEPLLLEARLTGGAMSQNDWDRLPGTPTDFTCPECKGSIRRIDEPGSVRFRCRVGHAYSMDSLVAAKDQAVEDALWLALQTLQERVQMLETLSRADRDRGRLRSASGFEARAREARGHADRLRDLLARLAGSLSPQEG